MYCCLTTLVAGVRILVATVVGFHRDGRIYNSGVIIKLMNTDHIESVWIHLKS
jgi:hypothetical protein